MQTQPDRDEESHQVAANARRALEQAIVTITKRPIDSHLSYLIDAMIRASKLDRETLTSTVSSTRMNRGRTDALQIQPGSLNSPTSAVDNTSNSNDTDHSNDVPGVPVDFVEDGHVPTTSNDGFEHLHFDKRGKAFFAFCHICNANTSKRSVRKYARGRSERIPYMDGAALLLHYESAHPHRNGARQWTDILDYCGKIYPSDSDVERLNSGRQPRNMAIVRPRLRPSMPLIPPYRRLSNADD